MTIKRGVGPERILEEMSIPKAVHVISGEDPVPLNGRARDELRRPLLRRRVLRLTQ